MPRTMGPEKREPPTRDRRPSGDNVQFAGFDGSRVPPQARKKQAAARGLIPIGSVAAQIVADPRFRCQVERLHALGPRVTAQLLAEIGAERSIQAIIDWKLDRFAGLAPEALEIAGGDRFWPSPLSEVPQ